MDNLLEVLEISLAIFIFCVSFALFFESNKVIENAQKEIVNEMYENKIFVEWGT